jgi:hypothetical protein
VRATSEHNAVPGFLQYGYKCWSMVNLPNYRLVLAFMLFASGLGCAHRKPAPAPMVYRPVPMPAPQPPAPIKLAKVVVLPVDKLALPGTAEELNAKLAQVRLGGAEAPTLATISMETAQLQSECSAPIESCYAKIASLVDTDRLLWAEVENIVAKAAPKKKAKKGETRIRVVLFDRDKLAVVGRAGETFPAAITGEQLDKLIATAVGTNAAPARPVYAPQPQSQPGYAAPPAQPSYAQPQPGYVAQPQQGYAAQPQPGYAAQPQPARPGYGTQPQPGSAQPTQPAYSQPTQPAYSQPTQPAYSQPTQPAYSQPTQPAYSQPAPPATPAASAPAISAPASAPSYQAPVGTPPTAPTPSAPTAPTAPSYVPAR